MYELAIDVLSESGKRIFINSDDPTYILVDGQFVLKKLEQKIIRVAIVKDTMIVLTDHQDLHRQLSYSMQPIHQKGNVFAMDTDGTLLWNIEEIIGPFRCAFSIAYVVSEKGRAQEEQTYKVKLEKDHDYLVCADRLDWHYLIDLTEKRLVEKAIFKC